MNGFFLTYLRRELRRRKRQALFTATGLAVGVALVLTVTAASTGVSDAQRAVLHSLYGIGTDLTVTTPAKPLGTSAPGSNKFGFTPGDRPQQIDYVHPVSGLGDLPASSVRSVARQRHVAAAAGGLVLTDTKLTVPSTAEEAKIAQGGPLPAGATPTSFNVDGVDVAHLGLGPYAGMRITSGRGLAAADRTADVVVLDSEYAAAHHLAVGSVLTVAKTAFTVVGIARVTGGSRDQGGGAVDAYIPLARAQALAQSPFADSYTDMVNAIYVAAANADAIPAVQAEISKALPSATVTSSANLASRVSGSLASATKLATDLGRWLAVAVLLAAFLVASLLTLAAVSRRVRELGTLKALGWRSRRVVGQLMGESLAVGVLGTLLGVALGVAGVAVVNAVAPTLTATVAQSPGSSPGQSITLNASGTHRSVPANGLHTVAVHLRAPVSAGTVALAVLLALAGALIAGSFGAWRAARLRPARALSRAS